MVGIVEYKRCKVCGTEKPLETGFYIDRRAKNGRSGTCINCANLSVIAAQKRRASEPLSPRVEAMRQYYQERFNVIRRAKLPMDEEGVIPQIDKLLKKHGLDKEIRRP